MSRASGAGAYSHGIAWPSPSPQLDGARSRCRDDARRGVGGHGRHYGTRSRVRPLIRGLSSGACGSLARRARAGSIVLVARLRVRPTPRAVQPAVGAARGPRSPPAPASLTEVAVAVARRPDLGRRRPAADGTGSDEVLVFDPAAGTWTTGPTTARGDPSFGAGVDAGRAGPRRRLRRQRAERDHRRGPAARRRRDGLDRRRPLPDSRAAGGAAFDGKRIVYAGGVKPGARRQRGLRARARRRRVDDGSAACRRRASTSP